MIYYVTWLHLYAAYHSGMKYSVTEKNKQVIDLWKYTILGSKGNFGYVISGFYICVCVCVGVCVCRCVCVCVCVRVQVYDTSLGQSSVDGYSPDVIWYDN